ncbi:DUF5050 domain-containing protein [Paenibacillus tyrfis]|uniref:DUF5050 domain-containing protein n=1 Tax=Paenibacillus tyrfis TaxID=1501230 RepID=UPI0020A13BE7|nr:DUF5050 domain-containing protein [Paenibacillus tyrfis]MCP1311454.1 DUF5050 domain-containing protein [Paenibacillus tyrfis]
MKKILVVALGVFVLTVAIFFINKQYLGGSNLNISLQEKDDLTSNKPETGIPKQVNDIDIHAHQGNLQNKGYVIKINNALYYSDRTALYKQVDSHITKLSDDSANYINAEKGWLYYSNKTDKEKIYRIKLDGSKREKISDDSVNYVVVKNEWIYFMNKSDSFRLYKMKMDGSSKTKMTDEQSFYINVVDDWLYYGGENDNIFKIRLDGSNKTKINDDRSHFINIVDGWAFYLNWADKGIYKIKIDGTSREKIVRGNVISFNVMNNWIYYSASDNGIHRVKVDGTEEKQITNINGYSINLLGDQIFILTDSKIVSMNTNGTDLQTIETASKQLISEKDKQTAIEAVKKHLEIKNIVGYVKDYTKVEVDHVDDKGRMIIQVYNVGNNRTSTINWYTYDPETKTLNAQFEE